MAEEDEEYEYEEVVEAEEDGGDDADDADFGDDDDGFDDDGNGWGDEEEVDVNADQYIIPIEQTNPDGESDEYELDKDGNIISLFLSLTIHSQQKYLLYD